MVFGKNYDHFKHGFETFCNGTSMHGFMELFNAKTMLWKVIWVVLLSAALGLTTYQCIRSINQFLDQSTNTRNEPLDQNDMFPPLKLCAMHWVYWLDWDKAFALKFTKGSILYGMSYLTAIYVEGDSYNVDNARNEFQTAMKLNNFTKLQQLYLNVAKDFHISESSTLTPLPALRERQIHVSRYWGPMVCYIVTGEVILETVRRNTYNITEYVELLIPLMTQQYYTPNGNITVREYSWYMSQFLTSAGIYYQQNFTDNSIKGFSTFTLPMLLYVDGFSQDYVPIRFDDDMYTVMVSISINRWRPDANFHCLVGQKYIRSNASYCGPACNILYPETVCKCKFIWQAIQINADDPSTLCQSQIYQINNESAKMISSGNLIYEPNIDCWKNETMKQLQQSCPACIFPCEQWRYSFSYIAERFGSTSVRDYFDKVATILRVVYPNDYDLFIAVEVERQTWEDFVANIGGLLGVWTGASLLSAVQLFYLCCFSNMDTNSCTFPSRKKRETNDDVVKFGKT